MGFASDMQQMASELLAEFDESAGRIQLVRVGAPVWDPDLAEMVPGASETINLVGVTTRYSEGLVNGTTIQSGDMLVTVTAAEPPKVDDKLMIDGSQWSIVSQPVVDYTGTVICYKMQVRR